jgi:hypothetical protein
VNFSRTVGGGNKKGGASQVRGSVDCVGDGSRIPFGNRVAVGRHRRSGIKEVSVPIPFGGSCRLSGVDVRTEVSLGVGYDQPITPYPSDRRWSRESINDTHQRAGGDHFPFGSDPAAGSSACDGSAFSD